MTDQPKPGSAAAGRARYLAQHARPEQAADPARSHKAMTGVQKGRAIYRAKAGDGSARAALQAQAEASAAAQANPFTGGDAA